MGEFIETNNIKLHYLDYPNDGEILILLHGLTANAHSFDGLINAGLSESMRVISVDLRGRGLSDKPDTGYSLEDHAQDILGLMDALGIEQAVLGGHSYGGRLSIYLAANYPERVKKLVLLDTGFFPPKVEEMVESSIIRLEKIYDSWESYIKGIQQSPIYHGDFWDEALEAYYRADVETLNDNSVKPYAKLPHIREIMGIAKATDWGFFMKQVKHEAILLHAPDRFGPGDAPHILEEEGARRAAETIGNCEYKRMSGNHMTMLFGENAAKIVTEIQAFVLG